jgi:hypothetical protein
MCTFRLDTDCNTQAVQSRKHNAGSLSHIIKIDVSFHVSPLNVCETTILTGKKTCHMLCICVFYDHWYVVPRSFLLPTHGILSLLSMYTWIQRKGRKNCVLSVACE